MFAASRSVTARAGYARKALAPLFALAFALFAALPAVATASELDVAQYRGKVVYLDFWASWCVPCRKSFPWLNELAKKYPDDLVVVGINVDHERSAANRFLEKYPAHFPLVFDPEGVLAKKYQLQGMPSSVWLDREGNIAERHIGFREESKANYETKLRKLMGK